MDISFNSSWADLGEITLDSALVFTVDTVGAIVGGRSFLRVLATGTGSIDLTAFTQIANANKITPESGVWSYLLFTYDGTDYNVTIWQKAKTPPLDIVLPEVEDIFTLSADATRNRIKIRFTEEIEGTTAGYSVRINGGSTITPTAIAQMADYAANGFALTIPTTYAYGDTVEIMYDDTTGDTTDLAGNALESFTWTTVKNNTPDPATVVNLSFNDSDTVAARDGARRTGPTYYDGVSKGTSSETLEDGDTMQFFADFHGSVSHQFQIVIEESGGANYIGFAMNNNTPQPILKVAGVPGGGNAIFSWQADMWMRVKLVGTSVQFSKSLNGIDWTAPSLPPAFVITDTIGNVRVTIDTTGTDVPQILKLTI